MTKALTISPHLAAAGDDSGVGDRGMFFERAFDLEGANAVAGADDDIVGASHEPEVAVLVLVGAIAGDVPVAANAGVGGFRIAPVLFEHPRRAVRLHAH